MTPPTADPVTGDASASPDAAIIQGAPITRHAVLGAALAMIDRDGAALAAASTPAPVTRRAPPGMRHGLGACHYMLWAAKGEVARVPALCWWVGTHQ